MDNVFSDFKLGNRTLSSFEGILYNNGSQAQVGLLPSITTSTDDIPGIDGLIQYSSKYDPRVIDLSIYIEDEDFNKEEFINWISAKTPQYFNYVGDNKKIKVIRQNQLDMSVYNEVQGTMEISFIAHKPHWELMTPNKFIQNTPVINNSYNFNNKGNTDSKPIIFLQTSGTRPNVKFSINGIEYNITTMTTDLYIDCDTETVYNFVSGKKVNRINEFKCVSDGYFRFTFPKLNIGNNTFKLLSSSLTKVTIDCNSRFI